MAVEKDPLYDIKSQFRTIPLQFGVDRKTDKVQDATEEDFIVTLDMVESWTGNLIENGEEDQASTGLVRFQPGDVLFNKLRPYLAKAFRATKEGSGSPEFLVLRPEKFHPKYLLYLLLSREFVDRVDASTYGAKMPRASWDFIGGMYVPCPDMQTQEEIARYLDYHTSRINSLIERKERLVSVIEEKHRSEATSLVTGGTEEGRDHEASDVPTLIQVPEDWSETRIGWHIRHMRNGWSPSAKSRPAEGDEYGVLKLSAVSKGEFEPRENKALASDTNVKSDFLISEGDVLITRANTPELVGDACYVNEVPRRLIAPDLMYLIDVNQSALLPEYLAEWLVTSHSRSQIKADAHGSNQSMVKISQEAVSSWRMPLPPLSEQKEIVNQIYTHREQTNELKAELRISVGLLEEKRQTLISNAISGDANIKNWEPPEQKEAMA